MNNEMSNERLGAAAVAVLAGIGLVVLTVGYLAIQAMGWQTGINTLRHLTFHFNACVITIMVAGTIAWTGELKPLLAGTALIVLAFAGQWGAQWWITNQNPGLVAFNRYGLLTATALCIAVGVFHFIRRSRENVADPA